MYLDFSLGSSQARRAKGDMTSSSKPVSGIRRSSATHFAF